VFLLKKFVNNNVYNYGSSYSTDVLSDEGDWSPVGPQKSSRVELDVNDEDYERQQRSER